MKLVFSIFPSKAEIIMSLKVSILMSKFSKNKQILSFQMSCKMTKSLDFLFLRPYCKILRKVLERTSQFIIIIAQS